MHNNTLTDNLVNRQIEHEEELVRNRNYFSDPPLWHSQPKDDPDGWSVGVNPHQAFNFNDPFQGGMGAKESRRGRTNAWLEQMESNDVPIQIATSNLRYPNQARISRDLIEGNRQARSGRNQTSLQINREIDQKHQNGDFSTLGTDQSLGPRQVTSPSRIQFSNRYMNLLTVGSTAAEQC